MSLRDHRIDGPNPKRVGEQSHRSDSVKSPNLDLFYFVDAPEAKIEDVTGYTFKNQKFKEILLDSYGSPRKLSNSFERLEWLGDRVIALSSANAIWTRYAGNGVKDYKSSQANNQFAKISKDIGLASCFPIGALDQWESLPSKFYADLLEAFVGAVFLDAGYNDCTAHLSENILSTLPAFNYSSSVNWLYELERPSNEAIEACITGYRSFNNRSLGYYIGSVLSEKSNTFKALPFVKQMVFLGKRVRDLLITSIVYNDNKEANPSELNKLRDEFKSNLFCMVVNPLADSFFSQMNDFNKDKKLFFLGGVFLDAGYDETLRVFKDSYLALKSTMNE